MTSSFQLGCGVGDKSASAGVAFRRKRAGWRVNEDPYQNAQLGAYLHSAVDTSSTTVHFGLNPPCDTGSAIASFHTTVCRKVAHPRPRRLTAMQSPNRALHAFSTKEDFQCDEASLVNQQSCVKLSSCIIRKRQFDLVVGQFDYCLQGVVLAVGVSR